MFSEFADSIGLGKLKRVKTLTLTTGHH
uniref:Uncharacterized protein n=1 Tax=Tetranychus urticae TaxID=32264 RepID=T1KG40_TETUR